MGAATARRAQRIQSLWSGYGEIVRFELSGAEWSSVVVKLVDARAVPRHPRGWAGDASHLRKCQSYEVERHFYREFSSRCADECRVPRALHLEGGEGRWLFILEDLDAAGFSERCHRLSDDEMGACLSWLASFHATFLGARADGLWETGTYWHLGTRPDELRAMKDKELKEAAPALDAALNQAKFQTLVHGDAKVANFCFLPRRRREQTRVAAVDFQYVGRGVGVKDVAYLLSSCLDEGECAAQAEAWLGHYFECLSQEVIRRKGEGLLPDWVHPEELEAEWRALYPVAWADFLRFLDGWAPGHSKIHGYSLKMARQALLAVSEGAAFG